MALRRPWALAVDDAERKRAERRTSQTIERLERVAAQLQDAVRDIQSISQAIEDYAERRQGA